MSLVKSLELVLADTYALYLKTQNYHWNIEGPRFKELHSLFESYYNDLADAIDTVAELIRGLGEKTPGTFAFFMNHTSIKNGNEHATEMEMLKELLDDQYNMIKTLETALKDAKDVNDEVVAGFLIERMTVHRKNAWMMRSSI